MRAMSGEWVELDNGCLCCSVKNDFVQALESLMRKKQKPQAIVIETTGARANCSCPVQHPHAIMPTASALCCTLCIIPTAKAMCSTLRHNAGS